MGNEAGKSILLSMEYSKLIRLVLDTIVLNICYNINVDWTKCVCVCVCVCVWTKLLVLYYNLQHSFNKIKERETEREGSLL